MSDFTAFPADTQRFLADLAANNASDWVKANDKRYRAAVTQPAKRFVDAVGNALSEHVEALGWEARVNRSIFRMNRDTRFSTDKRPYKDHMDFYWWLDEYRKGGPGFFARITADGVGLGCGLHAFDPETLARWRAALVDPERGADFDGAIEAARAGGLVVAMEAQLKKVPRGFPADHPRAEWLKYKGLHVGTDVDTPAELTEGDFPAWVAGRLAPAEPLVAWLRTIM
jgi:uncharacterized protein (TIGR02453 family)